MLFPHLRRDTIAIPDCTWRGPVVHMKCRKVAEIASMRRKTKGKGIKRATQHCRHRGQAPYLGHTAPIAEVALDTPCLAPSTPRAASTVAPNLLKHIRRPVAHAAAAALSRLRSPSEVCRSVRSSSDEIAIRCLGLRFAHHVACAAAAGANGVGLLGDGLGDDYWVHVLRHAGFGWVGLVIARHVAGATAASRVSIGFQGGCVEVVLAHVRGAELGRADVAYVGRKYVVNFD